MILGLGGKLSGGKTVTSVRFAHDQWLSGKKVLSNIELNFPRNNERCYKLTNEQFVDYLKANFDNQQAIRKMFENSVLLLDEIGNILSARKSTSLLNEMITQFIMMAGKLNCDIVYTAQLQESQADLRLRGVTNIYGNCYRYTAEGFKPLIFENRVVTEKILIVVIMEFDFDLLGRTITQMVYDPSPYYSMYDTKEITLLDRTKYLRGGSKQW